MSDINETISDRERSYGDYSTQSELSMSLIDTMVNSPNWYDIDPAKRQSLMMIQLKIGRLLNGDSNHKDSWHDIGGYANLAENTCKVTNTPAPKLSLRRILAYFTS